MSGRSLRQWSKLHLFLHLMWFQAIGTFSGDLHKETKDETQSELRFMPPMAQNLAL